MTAPDRRDFLGAMAGLAFGMSVGSGIARASVWMAEPPVPLRLLFFGGALPEVQKELEKQYLIQAFKGGQAPGNAKEDNVTGLEQLATAEVWIGSAHKRTFPNAEQLGHFKKYLAAGKPFVGYRAASHVFQNWLEVDKEVFGAKYGSHHLLGKEKDLVITLGDGAKDHSILKGIEPPPPRSGSYSYTELASDVKVLLYSGLPGNMMPHTLVRENAKTGGRAFYTRYDSKELASAAVCRQIFLRGLEWALKGDLTKHRKAG